MPHAMTERLSSVLALSEDVELTRAEIIELLRRNLKPGTVGEFRDALISQQGVAGMPHHSRLWSILVFFLETLPRGLTLSELCDRMEHESRPPALSELFEQDAKETFWLPQKVRFWRAAYRARQREAVSNVR